MKKAIGVLGGTFDPVHLGHIGLARDVYQQCELAEMRLMPLFIPAHREKPLASPEHRLRMLRLAVTDVPGLVIDERELLRQGVSYSVDTLRSLRQEFHDSPVCMVMGADAFLSFHTWMDWQEIPSLAHLIIINRPGAVLEPENGELQQFFSDTRTGQMADLHQEPAGRTLVLQLPERDISSTFIRQNIDNKKIVHPLLCEDVYSYINKEGLYHRH